MVFICMEYVENRVDKVYVYVLYEEDMIFSSFFYFINNNYVECYKVNDVLKNGEKRYDVFLE